MTEKYKWKNASEQEKPADWWGEFLKEIKVKYGQSESKRENGADSEDAPTYKVDI